MKLTMQDKLKYIQRLCHYKGVIILESYDG